MALAFQLMNLFGGGFLMVNSGWYGARAVRGAQPRLGLHRHRRAGPGGRATTQRRARLIAGHQSS
jgi:hypothetical protein